MSHWVQTKDLHSDDGSDIGSADKVLGKPMKILLSVSPNKEMGDRTRKSKNVFDLGARIFFFFSYAVSHFLTGTNVQWVLLAL